MTEKVHIFYTGSGDELCVWRERSGFVCFSEENFPFELPAGHKPWSPLKEEDLYSWHQPQQKDWSFRRESLAVTGSWVPVKDLEDIQVSDGGAFCRSLGSFWGAFSGSSEQNIHLPSFITKKLQGPLQSVTFFGGTFHPWHKGHQACLDLCPEENIIVVPDSNPWKGEGLKQRNEGHDYWSYFRELANKLKNSPCALFPGFVGLPEGNPTVTWLPNFSCQKKKFLMGADNFLSLHKWTNVQYLLNDLKSVYVVSRGEDENKMQEQRELLESEYPHLVVEMLGKHPYESLSSTKLRSSDS